MKIKDIKAIFNKFKNDRRKKKPILHIPTQSSDFSASSSSSSSASYVTGFSSHSFSSSSSLTTSSSTNTSLPNYDTQNYLHDLD